MSLVSHLLRSLVSYPLLKGINRGLRWKPRRIPASRFLNTAEKLPHLPDVPGKCKRIGIPDNDPKPIEGNHFLGNPY